MCKRYNFMRHIFIANQKIFNSKKKDKKNKKREYERNR